MFVPDTLNPVSAAVKLAVSEVIIGEVGDRTASVTERVDPLSTRNELPVAFWTDDRFVQVDVPVGAHVPVIDVTNVRGAMPGPVIDRFTKPVADLQSATLNGVAPAAAFAAAASLRAAPLW